MQTNRHAEAKQVTSLGRDYASINCLSAPTKTTSDNYFTAQVQGASCAIRFLKANATKYGINPNKIVVKSDSAIVVNPNSGHGGPLFSAKPEYREQNCTAQSFLGIIFK